MNRHLFAVILAGGKGERFWPLSTSRRPKQFLSVVGGKPLLAFAVGRLNGFIPKRNIFIITRKELVAATRKVARGVPAANIIGEPVGRDTAAAIAVGAALVKARDPDGVFCVLTADHLIGNIPLFHRTLAACADVAAQRNALVTIGIRPTAPDTGYGYIEQGGGAFRQGSVRFFKARRFVEKPALATARKFVRSGRYFWNSGMFVWSVAALEEAMRRHAPALLRILHRVTPVAGTPGLARELRKLYPGLPRISIDYALMEKTGDIIMAAGDFAWDDVGSWTALAKHVHRAEDGNFVIGQCRGTNSTGNIVVSRNRLTALIGVRDMVVVQSDRVTLICARDKAQDVKKLVEELRSAGRYDEVL